MNRKDVYAIMTKEAAKALVTSVSALGQERDLSYANIRDALWVLERRYDSLGLDKGYDALVELVLGRLSRMTYAEADLSRPVSRKDRAWLVHINSKMGGTPYGDFLAGKVVSDSFDDDTRDDVPMEDSGEWESTLTKGQAEAFAAVKAGENVFLTGNGGTGKSYLINGIIEWAKGAGLGTIVCAPTGIAALNVGGSTIHRTLGISPNMVLGAKRNPPLPKDSPLPKCDLMIVDEISMCRLDLFDYLSSLLFSVGRERKKVGLDTCQLVVVGDFFQLPPVITNDDVPMLTQMYGRDVKGGYAFMGTEWDKWKFRRITLTETIRQKDKAFVDALEKCRVGDMDGVRWIEGHCAKKAKRNAIILCGMNSKAKEENGNRLGEITAPATGYRGEVWGDVKPQDMPTDLKIRLKAGARVMCVVNDPDGAYMNGSLGTVVACRPRSVIVDLDDGGHVEIPRHVWSITKPVLEDGKIRMETVGEFTQIPLKLAWAITIHKSQGQTFDSAVVYPYCWDCGQLYTALSRLTDVSGLCLATTVQARYLKTSEDVIRFERRAGSHS